MILALVPKAPLAGQVAALVFRLDGLSEGLNRLQSANALHRADWQAQHSGLVNFYIKRMRVEISLMKLSLIISDTTVDLHSPVRLGETMVRFTGDFLATIRGWGERTPASIRAAAEALLHPLRLVVNDLQTLLRWQRLHKHQEEKTMNRQLRRVT